MVQLADSVQAIAVIELLLEWLGEERVAAIRAPFRADDLGPLQRTRQLQKQWVLRDLLIFLDARRVNGVTEALLFERLMPLSRLASAVIRFNRTGSDPVPGRFRDLLLSDACADHAFEIIAAAFHDTKGFAIRWLADTEGRGEFAARFGVAGEDIYVECKRLSADVVEQLRSDQVAAMSDVLEHAIDDAQLCGTVNVVVGSHHVGRPSLITLVAALSLRLARGQGELEQDDVRITFDLVASEGRSRPYAELLALSESPAIRVHRIITGRREGAQVFQPRVYEFSGPANSQEWFVRKVEYVLAEDAADRQLKAEAPGVVCIELPMFRNVDPADALASVTPAVEALFQRDHIVGLLAVIDLATEFRAGVGIANGPGRLEWNAGARFRQATELWASRTHGREVRLPARP